MKEFEENKRVRFVTLGEHAIGGIEAKDDQQERLEEFTQRVGSGEFHEQVAAEKTIPLSCIDGRSPEEIIALLSPNAAGGSQTLFVADDLTAKRFAGEDETTVSGYKNTLEFLEANGFERGGHTDNHAKGEACGCGANDKLAQIYGFMSEYGDVIRASAETIGVDVTDGAHFRITQNAKRDRTTFSSGVEVAHCLKQNTNSENVPELAGEHKEVIAVINMRSGTTLNRAELAKEFGESYQAFNVDAWSFENGARALSVPEEEIEDYVTAMVYYNLAAAMVLGGPNLRVVVLN